MKTTREQMYNELKKRREKLHRKVLIDLAIRQPSIAYGVKPSFRKVRQYLRGLVNEKPFKPSL
jgi:hypothetical protein